MINVEVLEMREGEFTGGVVVLVVLEDESKLESYLFSLSITI